MIYPKPYSIYLRGIILSLEEGPRKDYWLSKKKGGYMVFHARSGEGRG